MLRDMSLLSDRFRPYADRLIAGAMAAGIKVTVIETLRSLEQQKLNVANGVSWTLNSKHLTGDAIDVAPTEYLIIKGWNAKGDLWQKLGDLGESIGMEWGGRWRQMDLPHFQWKEPVHVQPEKS